MARLSLLTFVVLLAAALATLGWEGASISAQSPPGGDPPEPDAAVLEQIAELTLSAQAAGQPVDAVGLRSLTQQLDPAMGITVTLGGAPVGGMAKAPDTRVASLEVGGSSHRRLLLAETTAIAFVGVVTLGGILWRLGRGPTKRL